MQGLVKRMKDHHIICAARDIAVDFEEELGVSIVEPDERDVFCSDKTDIVNSQSATTFNTSTASSSGSATASTGSATASSGSATASSGSATASTGSATATASIKCVKRQKSVDLTDLANKKHSKTSFTIQPNMDRFVMKTSVSQKEDLDLQVSRYVFATNTPFISVEHPEFVKLVEMLRPGYSPPNRHNVGGKFLDQVYTETEDQCREKLKGKIVCMSLDGWSNVHNDPIVCACVTYEDKTFLVDTIDTSGNSHTAEYLVKVSRSAIKTASRKYECDIKSFVTDNAANVTKMRAELKKDEDLNLITYGCAAHILHLLSSDLDVPQVRENVVKINKYFRNVHFAHAMYKAAGGKMLVLPKEVRWNTLADCLGSFIKNWPILLNICEEHRDKIDPDIAAKVGNISLKRNAEDLLSRLKPIADALDRTQRSSSIISDTVHIWKQLRKDLREAGFLDGSVVMKKTKEREKMTLTPSHLLAYILDPRYRGRDLSDEETSKAMTYCNDFCPLILPTLIKYKANSEPFSAFMFNEGIIEQVGPLPWWMSFSNHLSQEFLNVMKQFLTAKCSSAGLERIFSTFGYVHSKVRNRLGTEKAAKLVTVFKMLNDH